jgi:hypothetical protein
MNKPFPPLDLASLPSGEAYDASGGCFRDSCVRSHETKLSESVTKQPNNAPNASALAAVVGIAVPSASSGMDVEQERLRASRCNALSKLDRSLPPQASARLISSVRFWGVAAAMNSRPYVESPASNLAGRLTEMSLSASAPMETGAREYSSATSYAMGGVNPSMGLGGMRPDGAHMRPSADSAPLMADSSHGSTDTFGIMGGTLHSPAVGFRDTAVSEGQFSRDPHLAPSKSTSTGIASSMGEPSGAPRPPYPPTSYSSSTTPVNQQAVRFAELAGGYQGGMAGPNSSWTSSTGTHPFGMPNHPSFGIGSGVDGLSAASHGSGLGMMPSGGASPEAQAAQALLGVVSSSYQPALLGASYDSQLSMGSGLPAKRMREMNPMSDVSTSGYERSASLRAERINTVRQLLLGTLRGVDGRSMGRWYFIPQHVDAKYSGALLSEGCLSLSSDEILEIVADAASLPDVANYYIGKIRGKQAPPPFHMAEAGSQGSVQSGDPMAQPIGGGPPYFPYSGSSSMGGMMGSPAPGYMGVPTGYQTATASGGATALHGVVDSPMGSLPSRKRERPSRSFPVAPAGTSDGSNGSEMDPFSNPSGSSGGLSSSVMHLRHGDDEGTGSGEEDELLPSLLPSTSRKTARMKRSAVLDSRVAEGTRTGTVSSKDGVSWGRVSSPVVHYRSPTLPSSWPPIPYPRDYLVTNLPPDDGRAGRLTRESIMVLRKWMISGHTWLSPYPTNKDIERLSRKTGMTPKQLRDWLRNERKRVWLPQWQTLLADNDCPWSVQRTVGGRANIIPKAVLDRYGTPSTELDLNSAIALELKETGEVPAPAAGSEDSTAEASLDLGQDQDQDFPHDA